MPGLSTCPSPLPATQNPVPYTGWDGKAIGTSSLACLALAVAMSALAAFELCVRTRRSWKAHWIRRDMGVLPHPGDSQAAS